MIIGTENFDDDLSHFEAEGATPLPVGREGHADGIGGRIWYAAYGSGKAVILLHGGLGNSGNWGYQIPALLAAGYRPVVIDSRGHGRSTWDGQPFHYEAMASDVLAVMDALGIDKAALVGWSDGACTAMILASKAPERVAGVYFFACNMDPSGTKDGFDFVPPLSNCFARHIKEYKQLSETPEAFDEFSKAVTLMQNTEPNYSVVELATIRVPVVIVQSENDEFIKREHAEYLAQNIPGAELVVLEGVSHFAPLQRPAVFNEVMLRFLSGLPA